MRKDAASQDRRVKRTEALLKDAMTTLLAEKDFPQITIRDITDRADLNRGTFYLHYRSTIELLASLKDDLLRDAARRVAAQPAVAERPGALLQFLSEHRAVCRAIYRSSLGGGLLRGISGLLQQYCLPADPGETAGPWAAAFAGWGLTGLMMRCLEGESAPEPILAAARDCMEKVV